MLAPIQGTAVRHATGFRAQETAACMSMHAAWSYLLFLWCSSLLPATKNTGTGSRKYCGVSCRESQGEPCGLRRESQGEPCGLRCARSPGSRRPESPRTHSSSSMVSTATHRLPAVAKLATSPADASSCTASVSVKYSRNPANRSSRSKSVPRQAKRPASTPTPGRPSAPRTAGRPSARESSETRDSSQRTPTVVSGRPGKGPLAKSTSTQASVRSGSSCTRQMSSTSVSSKMWSAVAMRTPGSPASSKWQKPRAASRDFA
mmetsp:Transcript_138502/g.386357  ORF Transcript_138502/g.386357 Transcript_138502/m.386357 type:complete len:261 (+) Transcript_138502:66-848(+)